jgi:hypothetical protein
MIHEIKPLVPKAYADNLQKLMTSATFPWFWNENISGQEKTKSEEIDFEGFQFGLFHVFLLDGQQTSAYYKDIEPLLYFMQDKSDIKVKTIYRVRAALTTWSPKPVVHNAHVDMDFDHKVLLYYVNDSDGDTILYNEVFEEYGEVPNNFTVQQTSTPSKGNGLVFDGLTYHSSSKPTKNSKRIIINIDFN